jgi:hypothetical protein
MTKTLSSGGHNARVSAIAKAEHVTVREVAGDSRAVIERLAQLERHDLSEFRGMPPDADGVYEVRWLPGQPDLPPDIWIFLDNSSLVGSVR